VGLQGKYVGPLCRVSVMINGKDVVMNPPVNDIYKYLTKLGKNIVESSKLFVRWMHGSCLECAPQFISEDEEPFIFSFLEVRPSCLISCRPMSLGPTQGSSAISTCRTSTRTPRSWCSSTSLDTHIQKVTNMTNKYLDGWRQY
jgi:hypothetical protein